MSEQFSIQAVNSNGLPITPPQDTRSEEGYLKDLTIEGILEILAGGLIQTSTGRWFLDLSGLRITSFDDLISPTTGSALEIFRASTTLTIGQVLGRHDTISGQEWVELRAEDFAILGKVNGADWVKVAPDGLTIYGTTQATSKDTGALIVEGGVGIEKNLHVGGALVAPKVAIAGITDADSPYSIGSGVDYIATDTTTGPITINLPAGIEGLRIVIFDYNGSAASNTVTINRNGSDTINGGTNTQLTNPYQSVTLVFYSGNWTII